MPLMPRVAIGMPSLPNMGRPPQARSGAALDRQNIDQLLSGQFDPYEINMQSAERAIGSGTPGSGFAQAGRYKLLDSEKLARKQLGHQMLDPYLNREHQQQLQTQSEAARLKEIAVQGELAMQQLQASQSGRMAELSQQEKAQLEYLAQQGSQALEQMRLQQSGQREITGMNIGGNIINTLLSRTGGGGGGGGGRTLLPGQRGMTIGQFSGTGAGLGAGALEWNTAPQGATGGSFGLRGWTPGGGSSFFGSGGSGGDANVSNLINSILKKYGFPNFNL